MRTSSDGDAGSSRSEGEKGFKEEVEDETRNSISDADSSSNNTKGSNPIQYTDQQQAELLRKLDSIKGHVLRVGDKPKDSDHPPMGFHGHGPSYYNPYPYGMYPPTSHVSAYRDPYGFPMHSRPPNWYPGHYPNQMLPPPPPPPPFPQGQGQYVDIGPDILDPQLQDPRFFPAKPNRYGDVPYSPGLQHGEKTGQFSPRADVQVHHTKRPSEIDFEMGGAFTRAYVSDADTRRYHPLAGGAPFVACHCCFELLYLPRKKLLASQEKEHKLQCGACSEVVSFTIVDKKLVFSSLALEDTTNQVSVEAEVRSARTVVVDACPLKVVSPSEHSDGDDERSSISSEPQKQVVKSVRRRVKDTRVPPPENSNLLELFEYSNVNRAALNYGMEQLGYNKQKSYKRQESVATEIDVSYNTEVSEDSRIQKTSKEESNEYSFSEFRNKSMSNDQDDEELEVWVNGHLIPEELVISAEKQAGPVQAGKYWYDYRAGFWGVMGQPCLGIIPPFIKEFSRPMADKCGAGNTSVFVNGRELHERDLELLAGRGLPRGKNRSYIVDIQGRVLDGDSGEELKGLGKLAPTVDKVKHGFGMRVPRSLVS